MSQPFKFQSVHVPQALKLHTTSGIIGIPTCTTPSTPHGWIHVDSEISGREHQSTLKAYPINNELIDPERNPIRCSSERLLDRFSQGLLRNVKLLNLECNFICYFVQPVPKRPSHWA